MDMVNATATLQKHTYPFQARNLGWKPPMSIHGRVTDTQLTLMDTKGRESFDTSKTKAYATRVEVFSIPLLMGSSWCCVKGACPKGLKHYPSDAFYFRTHFLC